MDEYEIDQARVVEADPVPGKALVPSGKKKAPSKRKQYRKIKYTLDDWVNEWILATKNQSDSVWTSKTYRHYIDMFRDALHEIETDLDGDPNTVASVALRWAWASWPSRFNAAKNAAKLAKGETPKVAASTFRERLGVLNSCFEFLVNHDVVDKNPIKRIKKPRIPKHKRAPALSAEEIATCIARIDRSTVIGMRDHALLCLGFATARRRSELMDLRLEDLNFEGGKLVIHFQRCKGGKERYDEITPSVQDLITHYLHREYGDDLSLIPPKRGVWLSHGTNPTHNGDPLTVYDLHHICRKHLGTSSTHVLRRSAAQLMRKHGASLEEVMKQLMHEDLGVTTRYIVDLEDSISNRTSTNYMDSILYG